MAKELVDSSLSRVHMAVDKVVMTNRAVVPVDMVVRLLVVAVLEVTEAKVSLEATAIRAVVMVARVVTVVVDEVVVVVEVVDMEVSYCNIH